MGMKVNIRKKFLKLLFDINNKNWSKLVLNNGRKLPHNFMPILKLIYLLLPEMYGINFFSPPPTIYNYEK